MSEAPGAAPTAEHAGPPTDSVVRRVVSGLGRVLITGGLLTLLFVAYQLWGTNLYEARAQSQLRSDFDRELEQTEAAREPVSGTTTTTQPLPPPPGGEPIGIIRIPKIGLERTVVQGNTVPDLRKGPGHISETAMPGAQGNAAIAGHRTTYGAPFNRLDELAPGDEITVQTLAGTYRYAVTGQLIVSPRDVYVLDPTPDARLTLTTCNPKYSARQRLVVQSVLVPEESAPPVEPVIPRENVRPRSESIDDLVGPPAPRAPVVWWALIATVLGAGWWAVFHRRRRWYVWIAGAVPFLAAYAMFCFYLERLLPPGF